MLEFITIQAPAARRVFGRSLLRHTFGHLPGDLPTSEEVCTGLGRTGDDYLICCPIKKSRSHSSMAQTTESVLEPEDGCYVVTSAPDNAYCLIDTDGEAEDDDAESACCAKGGSSVETGCCLDKAAAPLQLHHSASSSTALSSAPSGISSPSPPALLASRLPCDCDTGRCQRTSAQETAGLGSAATIQAANGQREKQQQQQHGRTAPVAMAAAVSASGPKAAREVVMDALGEDGIGSDLIGAFCALTSDQWAAFKAAVSISRDAAEPSTTVISSAELGAVVTTGTATTAAAAEVATSRPRVTHPPSGGEQQRQEQYSAMADARHDMASQPQPQPQPQPQQPQGRGLSATRAPAAPGSRGSAVWDGDGLVEAAEHASRGGFTSSVASFWAAVTNMAGGAVYDSTDDNAQAGEMLGHDRGWSRTSTNIAALSVPAAGQSAFMAVGSATEGPRAHEPARAQVGAPTRPHSHTRAHSQNHRDHRLEAHMAARYTHHAGVLVQHPALAPPQEDEDGGRDGALSLPGSPATRVMSCTAEVGSGSVIMSARNQLLREYNGQGSQPPRASAVGDISSANTTINGSYSYGDGGCGTGYSGSYSRAAAQARSNAHSRFSVDLHHCPRQPYSQSQQQSQQHYTQQHGSMATAVRSYNPGSPSRRRGAGSLGLQPQSTSYTTYGYRRACSSLAAVEQMAGAVVGSRVSGSSSDDEDDAELEGHRLITAFRSHTGMMARSSGWGLLGADSSPTTAPGGEGGRRDQWASVTAAAVNAATTNAVGGSGLGPIGNLHSGGCGRSGTTSGEGGSGETTAVDKDGGSGDNDDGLLTRKRSSYHLTNSHAAVELFLRLNHARQTMDFVKRQTQLFANLDKAKMTMWEALQTFNELREYEAVLLAEGGEALEIAELPLLEHAFQTAELCRLHHPDLDWLHLVGLMHGLGKLLAHRRFGAQPQWAICGETYPLGCRFSPHILGSQYFTANPDRRRRLYNTPTGLYDSGCGLLNVVMSWSSQEYLYLVLMLNRVPLPQDALWILRHAKFLSLTRPHSCYLPLCSGDDLRLLPLLRSFQSMVAYRRMELPEGFALTGEARTAYYTGLIARYIGDGPLQW
ncbi:hypothetical protein VaNZ11_014770 [Volvox africanus]|uniref:Inositol oxygenase n=1 Tax=Volvox africanus TaxID=51714 RepID=A0ABQ5SKM1_9CHLO|nr:hypothetical protein VaNZ11_014770 [Volvox africanus]